MYKCTDCGQEFETKPEYCDCGNNVFEESMPAPAKEQIKQIEQPKQTAETPAKPAKKNPVDIYSILIFIACIILSILSIIFIGKDVQTPEAAEKPVKEIPKTNIPSIDKIWVESEIKEQKPITPEPKTPQIQENKPQTVQPVKSPLKTLLPPAKNQVQKPSANKVTTTPKTVVNKTNTQAQPPAKPAPKENITPAPKVDNATLQKELASYKISLRNKISSNINFTNVIGDGNCAITFKIDQSGNLVNRAFSIQSPNDSLNDVVYDAIMQTPTFKAPPAGYKNETLTLSVKVYGTQFETNLK